MFVHPWYALNVRTNSEQKVQKALEDKGYTVFLPAYLDSRPYSDRIKKVLAALFPGYLFCRFDALVRLPVLKTAGVLSIVSVAGEPSPIAEEQIDAIQRVVDAGLAAEPWPYLQRGDMVCIQFGALAGVEGQIVRVPGGERLVLSIHLLQRSISVEMDRSWIRPTGRRTIPLAIRANNFRTRS